jgi:hypothetical protein
MPAFSHKADILAPESPQIARIAAFWGKVVLGGAYLEGRLLTNSGNRSLTP